MADLTVTATSVLPGTGPRSSGTAGEAITAGQALYLKSSDGKLWKAQCDGTVEEATVIGVALNGAAADQPVQYQASGSTMTIGATTAKTTTYVLSAAAGGICPQADLTSGQRIVRLGHATGTAGEFTLDIRNVGAVV